MMLIASIYEIYKRMYLTEIYEKLRKELGIDVSMVLAEEQRAKKPWLNGETIKDHNRTIVLRDQSTLKLVAYRPEVRNNGS